ncbi:efflux RND transporter permease subunit [Polyangium mundeleinium]|uniref:MMPL family transporter n=1 Tax=Polyangium mundeleinium TaxID=2995306 RepID=A0ABT5F0Y8_9BACT|nr:MMPL family transporter [Polyangium mundeleinium]MDC0747187.1 MMPL family transporter [Polyangium mundeleinium]
MHERSSPRPFRVLGRFQARRPFLVLLLGLLSLLPAGFFATKIGFRPDFSELLPDNKDSVIEMRRVSARLSGITTLTVTAEIADGKNEAALRAFVDALAPKLQALGPPWVEQVDWSSRETKKFFDENKLLFAELADLQKARDEVVARYEYEVQKETGVLLDESDPPPPITAASLKERLTGKKGGEAKALPKSQAEIDRGPHPNGYYMSADGKFAAVIARTSLSKKADREELRRKIEQIVEEIGPKKIDPTMEVGYTGDLVISGEEYDAIVQDLGEVGVGGVLGVLVPVLLFFLRVRTVLVMAGSLLVGLVWTFGLTYFTIGYLNSSTGFLVTIIAGNGINYGIMYMARYLEARRDDDADVEGAIEAAHKDTWLPTLSGSATTMLAYGSLMLTDFRGFKHFGVIGAYGMLLCWLATYLFTPALLAATERVRPVYFPGKEKTKARGYYGVLFAKLAQAAPRTLGAIGVVIGLISVGLTYQYLTKDPIEYDMRNIRSERRDKSAALSLSVRVGHIVGRMSQDGMAVMTDHLEQVPLLETELQKRLEAAPADAKPFEKVVTIHSLIPKEQAEKLPLIEDIRRIVQKARKRNLISDADWAEIAPYVPAEALKSIAIADLPETVARPFTEKDGTRGRIVYIVPKQGQSVWDAHYLIRWADSFRATTLPTGDVIKGSGRAVIYADMIQAVVEDAPKAVGLAAIGVVVIILIAFRGSARSLGVFVPWLFGVSMLLGFLHLRGIKLNFLNFIVLPITFGIGAEYSHNLMQRYLSEGGERLDRVFTETGGALVLCSMTTCIGYFALMFSINKGIASFGLAAAVGEIACLLSAVLILPAFLVWLERRRKAAKAPEVRPEGASGA